MNYIVANWKMNMSLLDITKWVDAFKLPKSGKVTAIIAPPTPYLGILKDITNNTSLRLSGQDVSLFEKGAHTGETGAFQLKDFANYCIVGHSERKEPRETVAQKAKMCLAVGITPIVCFVKQSDLAGIDITNDSILAWEDPSNISVNGEYRAKNSDEISVGVRAIRSKVPSSTALLYGGSVNRQNMGLLAKIDKLDGALVGNASLDPVHFSEIVRAFS